VAVWGPARSSSASEAPPARRARWRLAGRALPLLALVACGTAVDPGVPPGVAVVTAVIDVDTVAVELAGRAERVRLLGIDTPETVAPNRPVECYGAEASQALQGLVPAGTHLHLVLDTEARDRFDRLLAYVYRADDGLFVNAWMVAEGFAATLVFEPNTAFAGELATLERTARAAGRGLWGVCGGPDRPLE
jgi:micrococcal nuclease